MGKGAIISLFLVFILSFSVSAAWTGWQSVTWETGPKGEWLTIYTTALGYSFSDSWHVGFLADKHPLYGLDLDFSLTKYLGSLSATAGVRRGVYKSSTALTPYVSLLYQF